MPHFFPDNRVLWYNQRMNSSKIMDMERAAALLLPGNRTLALGGNSLHRVPHGFVRVLSRRDDLSLHLVKTAGAYDIDLLCLAELVVAVSAGFVGYETRFGLARHYRRAVEGGATEAREHACYTVIASLRAASFGLDFLPVRGLDGSDLVEARGFRRITNPYAETESGTAGDSVVAIPAIKPDLAVIHVQYADRYGNGVILGPKCEDLLMARAASRVVLTTEHLVATEELPVPLDHLDVPGVLVDGVVHMPRGAWPGSCHGEYTIDTTGVEALLRLRNRTELLDYLDRLDQDHPVGDKTTRAVESRKVDV